MNRPLLMMSLSLVVLVGLVCLLAQPQQQISPPSSSSSGASESTEPLLLLCAASNRAVIEVIKADYEALSGERIRIEYGASQTLLSSHEVAKTGDLFLPADDFYMELAKEKHLVDEVFPLARMQAVVAVPKGNPRHISSLSDLRVEGLQLAQANPDAAAIGKLTRTQLSVLGEWDSLLAHTAVMRTTVIEVANDVKVRAVDAGIVWDAVLTTYPDLEAVPVPELQDVVASIPLGVLKSTKQAQRALRFARYVAAEDKGLARYREFGFQTAVGNHSAPGAY